MHWLTREVRFCIDPLKAQQPEGANPFAAKPAGNGLSFFLALSVTLRGRVDPETGFVLNVSDIDALVRQRVVPVFVDRISNRFGRRRPVGFSVLTELLGVTERLLKPHFPSAQLDRLSLKVTPYRRLSLFCKDLSMAYYSEKFEFAAMHKLWNDRFSEEENFNRFGKCANPAGHGHNYVVEVTVQVPKEQDLDMCAFEETVEKHLISHLDHKSLNLDVPYFREVIPTMENIAQYAWEALRDHCAPYRLHEVIIWESDRTRCAYRGPEV